MCCVNFVEKRERREPSIRVHNINLYPLFLLLLLHHRLTTYHVDIMKSLSIHCLYLLLCLNINATKAFVHHNRPTLSRNRPSILNSKRSIDQENDSTSTVTTDSSNLSRRSMMEKGAQIMSAPLLLNTMILNHKDHSNISNIANAAVGTLPEFADTNAVLQGITVDVADLSQQKDMINFLVDGFQFKILRQRKILSITETVSLYNHINLWSSSKVFLSLSQRICLKKISGWDLDLKK